MEDRNGPEVTHRADQPRYDAAVERMFPSGLQNAVGPSRILQSAKRNRYRSNVVLSVESSAMVTRTTFAVPLSVLSIRSKMNRARFSPVGISFPSANSGTSRLMLRW